MTRTREVEDVLQFIQNQPKLAVRKQNIFDTPVRLYLIIKSMYQNYKKANMLQLMQERIFDIKLTPSITENYPLTKVSASSIFQYHTLSQHDLILLIKMKESLKEDIKAELYGEILLGVEKLEKVGQVLNCYRTFLNLQFYNKKRDMYTCIEEKMINKLVSMNLKGKDFNIIAKNILALPLIKQPILVLISKLYEKIATLMDYEDLYLIFIKNFPLQPNKTDIEALVRINVPDTLSMIVEMIERKDENSELVLEIAEKQAKHKLEKMELTMSSKTYQTLNFIVQVVKFGRPIWHQIIEWEHKATQEPKNFIKESLQSILIAMLKDPKKMQTVLGIIEKITEIDQHSQIGLIFVRQLLNLQDREYLSHKIIRRFLAIKILKYNSSQQYVKQIFGKGLKFIDVVLEMFNFELNVLNFYLHLFNNEEHLRLLNNYFEQLSEKLPTKLKQFYLRCNAIDKTDALGNVINNLLKMVGEAINLETAVSLVRDLALIPPSKHLLSIFMKFLTNFKSSKQISVLKTQIVRSLNIILIRTPKQQLNKVIKISLPNLIKQHLLNESRMIFQNVPDETSDYLKKCYEDYLAGKKI